MEGIPFESVPFEAPERAEAVLASLARASSPGLLREIEGPLFQALVTCPDPDDALVSFERYCQAQSNVMPLLALLAAEPAELERLIAILGHSGMLADTLVRNPELRGLLHEHELRPRSRDEMIAAARASTSPLNTDRGRLNALRRFKRREMLRIGGADILGVLTFEQVVEELSLLADACLEEALGLCRERLEARFGWPRGQEGQPIRFCVISLGKLGGAELNYSSDIDLMFVCGGQGSTHGETVIDAASFYERLAGEIAQAMSEVTEEGFVFRTDCRLRPEGRSGPLVRDLASFERYYAERARPWERMALIRARCSAGDSALGDEFIRIITPYVYGRAPTADEVEAIRRNKEAVERRVRAQDQYYTHVKEGYGGIRDVEFAVQLTQLRVGHARREVQTGNCLQAIRALRRAGVITAEHATVLSEGYVFLRQAEHALQMVHEQQLSHLPADDVSRRALAARVGVDGSRGFDRRYKATTRAVRETFDHLFLGEPTHAPERRSDAQLWVLGHADEPEVIHKALARHGFRHPEAAEEALREMATEEEATRQRLAEVLHEVLIECEGSGDADSALAHLSRLVSQLGDPQSLYWFFHDYPVAVHRLCHLCGRSGFLSHLMARRPELLDAMLEPGVLAEPKPRKALEEDLRARLAYETSHSGGLRALRLYKAREMLRIGMRDVAMDVPLESTLLALTELAEVCLAAGLEIIASDGGVGVLGLGKLGGRELHYSSDLDVVFVAAHLPEAEYDRAYDVCRRLVQGFSQPSAEGVVYGIDARLRPGGKEGPLLPTPEGYRSYYATRASEWEKLAAVRTRPVCGNEEAMKEAMGILHDFAYARPLTRDELAEIHRIHGRIASERDRRQQGFFNVKLGDGGTLDTEFAAQALQIDVGCEEPAVRLTGTVEALQALQKTGALPPAEAREIIGAYRLLRMIENRLQIVEERSRQTLALEGDELEIVAAKLPYDGRDRGMTGEELARELEHARQISREFYRRVILGPIE